MTDDVNDIDSELASEVKDIVGEAKKTFSLGARLENRGYREDNLILYTDDEHAYAHAVVAAKLKAAELADDQDAVATLTEQLANLAELTRDSKITLTLQAVPAIVLKDIKRKARKAFVKKGPVPEEKLDEYFDVFNHYVVGACIRRVVDVDGAVDETNWLDHNNVKILEDLLPISQWEKLWAKVEDIQFSDKIGQLATSDPDF